MKVEDKEAKGKTLDDFGRKVVRYLKDLPPEVLEVQRTDSVEVLGVVTGSYNINFHVSVDGKEFIFRINIEQQSKLQDQIGYEYAVLKFLEGYDIAPKVFHIDKTRRHINYGILIEEYFDGPPLSLEGSQISEVAELLVRLHSMPVNDMEFIIWSDPLMDNFHFVNDDIINYEAKKTSSKKVTLLAKKLLTKTKVVIEKQSHLFHANSLNHTDIFGENFIKTARGLRLIDWEKPRIDDYSYDICCFLSEPAELYNSTRVLNSEERDNFLNTYIHCSGKSADLLIEKVKIREPLVSLHWILWGATMLCDLRDRRKEPALLEAQKEKAGRYERIANPDNIEKLLDGM